MYRCDDGFLTGAKIVADEAAKQKDRSLLDHWLERRLVLREAQQKQSDLTAAQVEYRRTSGLEI